MNRGEDGPVFFLVGGVGICLGAFDGLWVEEVGVGVFQFGADVQAVLAFGRRNQLVHVELAEEALVEQAAHRSVGPPVQLERVRGQAEVVVHVSPVVGVVAGAQLDLLVDLFEADLERVLFTPQGFAADGLGQIGVHQGVLCVFEFLLLRDQRGKVVFSRGHHLVELGVQQSAYPGAQSGRDDDLPVEVSDVFFDHLNRDGLHLAGPCLVLPSGAHEVRVDPAG
ncbi:MAG: hypothetical protein LBS56_07275 [Propionibacteriaceae bacterium]|nr:hypothetical protein [Propionibacteriaceae bacterium]